MKPICFMTFCSMHNYSANAAFAFRLAKQQRIEKRILTK